MNYSLVFSTTFSLDNIYEVFKGGVTRVIPLFAGS